MPVDVFVNRVTKGYRRLFFQVSLPLLVIPVEDGKLTMAPDEVCRDIADLLGAALDNYLGTPCDSAQTPDSNGSRSRET